VGLRQAADARDTAVDRVVAHRAAAPAGQDQLVTRYDLAAAAGKRHQHLHHPRLDDFVKLPCDSFTGRGANFCRAEGKRRLPRKVDRLVLRLDVHL